MPPHRGRISNFCGLPTAGGANGSATDSRTSLGVIFEANFQPHPTFGRVSEE